MSTADVTTLALDLPPEERLELARRLVESVITPASLESAVQNGIRRIEDVLTGKVNGLTEAEFRSTLR
ncbi:MAG TPA: addiction module protein [Verrucomicrobiae bacterium]